MIDCNYFSHFQILSGLLNDKEEAPPAQPRQLVVVAIKHTTIPEMEAELVLTYFRDCRKEERKSSTEEQKKGLAADKKQQTEKSAAQQPLTSASIQSTLLQRSGKRAFYEYLTLDKSDYHSGADLAADVREIVLEPMKQRILGRESRLLSRNLIDLLAKELIFSRQQNAAIHQQPGGGIRSLLPLP